MYGFTSDALDVDAIRGRIRQMSDVELQRYGRSAKYMASPEASYGPPRETWAVQLSEARAEWKRRQAAQRRG